jgi:AbrB family looped-hinge helix DNA binding protein
MKTRVSSKGQIVIPKSVRNHYKWTSGTVLKIEETATGVVLSPATNPTLAQDEVYGCLKQEVTRKVSLSEMDQAILDLAKKSSK